MDGELGFPITVDELGWIGSFMPLGAAFCSLFTGTISDMLGRKLTMLVAIIPITIGWSLIIWSNSVTMIYFGRLLSGAVAGTYCVLAPMYSTEIAEKKIRGALGCFTQLNIALGIILATLLGSYLDIKLYSIICGCIPLLFGIIFVFMPESPFYLLKKGHEGKARESLKFFRGKNYDIEVDLEEIKNILKERGTFNMTMAQKSLKTKGAKRACLIAFFLMIFRVFCGVDAITAYTSYILDFADLQMDHKVAIIVIFSLQAITGIVQAFLVDFVGRKLLLLLSIITTTAMAYVVGITIYCKEHDLIEPSNLEAVGYIPLAGLIIFYVGYALGLGPIPWMILSEIFPQEIKSVGSSIANFVSWMSTFIVVKLFLVVENNWGGEISFILLAVISTIGIFCLYFTVHETKGKSLVQIQQELNE